MLEDYLSSCKKEFKAHTELRAQCNRNRRVALLSGNLVLNARTEQSGVCARVYQNGVYGFASAAQYEESGVRDVLRAATENAAFMDSRVKKGKGALPQLPSGAIKTHVDIGDTAQKEYIDFARSIDDYIVNHYKNLTARTVSVSDASIEKLLCVSNGMDTHLIRPRSFIAVVLTAETADGVPVELYEPFGGFGTFAQNFSDPASLYGKIDALYERLMQKREGIYADAGVKDVVMGPDLAGILAHEAVGHTVEADMVIGGSVAASNLNNQVASEIVTMVDFAHTALGKPVPIPVYVDDEGTEAKDAVLIKDGILTGYMHNRESAQHFDMEPCGNARAYAFSDEPLIRMRNTAILPGKDKLEDMIAAIDDGYYLISTNNGQADTTGEFMFGISMGYEIKQGKVGRAILDTTISGVAFDMLKTVDMLSDEMVWNYGTCGKKQPMPVSMGGPAVKCKVNIGGR